MVVDERRGGRVLWIVIDEHDLIIRVGHLEKCVQRVLELARTAYGADDH